MSKFEEIIISGDDAEDAFAKAQEASKREATSNRSTFCWHHHYIAIQISPYSVSHLIEHLDQWDV